jgi:hypothetical protein
MTIELKDKSGGGGSLPPWNNDSLYTIDDYIAGNYYESTVPFTSTATAITLTNIAFAPFVPFKDHTFTGMGFSCYGTQTTTIYMGLYDSDASGNPDSLLTANNLSVTLGGTAAFNVITIDEDLTADTLYWVALQMSAQTSTLNMTSIAHHSYRIGLTPEHAALINASVGAYPLAFPYMSHTAGNAFPATAVPDGVIAQMPRIWLKA